ncbi:MAG: PAS domain-containing protein [Gemmobacter sp.]
MFGMGFGRGGERGRTMTAGATRFATLAEVRAYWEGLRQDGKPPLRAEVDPRGMAGALEHSFVIERVAPGVARFRIAGMELTEMMGMDVRGMPMLSLIDPPDRSDFARHMEKVFTGPAILEMVLEAERGIGRPALEGRLLILPLRNRAGTTALALGCLATEGVIGRAPRRFGIARRAVTPLDAAAPVLAEGMAPVLADGMAESPAPFVPRPVPGHPHLRLVKG